MEYTEKRRAIAHKYAVYLDCRPEDLDDYLNGHTNTFVNAPLALIETGVQCQADTLVRLVDAGFLPNVDA